MHSIDWTAVTAGALLAREAVGLLRRQLAYRHQRWLVDNIKKVSSEGQSIQVYGPDQVTISANRGEQA